MKITITTAAFVLLIVLATTWSTPRDPYQHYPNIPGEVLTRLSHIDWTDIGGRSKVMKIFE